MTIFETTGDTQRGKAVWLIATLLAVCELLVLGLTYNDGFDFTCRDVLPRAYCAFASDFVPRAVGVMAVFTVAFLARPAIFSPLWSEDRPSVSPGLWLNLVGFAAVIAPLAWLNDASVMPAVIGAALAWTAGGVLATVGLALLLAPAGSWRQLFRKSGLVVAALAVVGLITPELQIWLFELAYPIWHAGHVTEITFAVVVTIIRMIGYEVIVDPSTQYIAADEFAVRVGPQCSGVEGFGLIVVFLTIYIAVFRRDLRFPHVLLLYPLGIAISWMFNVARIVVLLAIGADISPELAIGGFHSHAGWLAFTALSVILIVFSRTIPFFSKLETGALASRQSIFNDPVAARIVPFIVFMLSAVLLSTFTQTPSLYYPLRVLALSVAVLAFWSIYKNLTWRPSAEAWLAGLAVGLLWIVVPVSGEGAQPYGALTGLALWGWFVFRGIGTIVLVPIVEELFFRDYLQSRLRFRDGAGWTVLAVLLSAAAFAALHDRWVEAFVAALCFSFVMQRSGRVTDAIVAHAVANALIFVFALTSGNMNII